MTAYERSWWWVKEKKQMAFVFIIVTMMLQFQMKGCVGCLDSERIGLLQLKLYLVNVLHVKDENILKSWSHGNNSSDCCVWERVKCDDSIGGHIVDLSLDEIMPANYSTLPRPLNLSLLHSFPQLKTFSFSENYFTHFFDPIHGYKSFGRLKNLRNLDFSYNSLDNRVLPFLDAARSLRNLTLEGNSLDGVFPLNGLTNLAELEVLNLMANRINLYDFRAGDGYKSFQRLEKLRTLDLSYNELNNSVLPFISAAKSLRTLSLCGNKLKGVFNLNGLTNLRELKVLDLSDNGISDFEADNGYKTLQRLEMLSTLDLSSNLLNNSALHFLSAARSLRYLNLGVNGLKGVFPPEELANMTKLRELALNNNEFNLFSVQGLMNFRVLKVLDLRDNSINNFEAADVREDMSKLQELDLSANKFTDLDSVGAMLPSSLQVLNLAYNQLSFIPKGNMSFGGGRNNGSRSFGITSFSSNIPTLQDWSYTSSLNLDDDLKDSYLWTPNFTVEFSTKSRYEAYQGHVIRYMYGLDLSNNQLLGEIPVEIGNLEKIVSLNLSSNRLTGSIPDSISKLKDLESLDVSNNKLDGRIPPQLADLNSLGYLNVSYNNLSGEVPTNGHLLTFGEKSYIGNDHLCGGPTNKSCNPTIVPEAEEEEEGGDGVIDIVWFYWTCGAVYISTFLAVFVFLCIDTYWSRKWFYRVDLFINHLYRFKHRFVGN